MLSQLKTIENGVCARTWAGVCDRLWGGAGVVISDEPVEGSDYLVLVTGYAREASALMVEIRDACSDWLNFENKHRFYGSIAEAAVTYAKTSPDKWGLLEAMVREAIRLEQTQCRSLYFAYGSNMDGQQMSFRCRDARLVRPVTVSGYAFALDSAGVATIEKSKYTSVEGLLWSISMSDEDNLDRYEGVAAGCYRKEYLAVPQGDESRKMLVYISNRVKNEGQRHRAYMDRIITAAETHGFSPTYIVMLKALNA